MNIRKLRSEEIDCRVQHIREDGCSLVLYIDARVAMKILDESFGITGWQRKHNLIGDNLYCTISIWDSEKLQWISKEDVGVQSIAEGEKGQASDAFKRACINIGVARELYSAPFIWVNLSRDEVENIGGKFKLKGGLKFFVRDIDYDLDGNIRELIIIDQRGNLRWSYSASADRKKSILKSNSRIIEEERTNIEKVENKKSDEILNDNLKCESCGVNITSGIDKFSRQNYGKSLCLSCQNSI